MQVAAAITPGGLPHECAALKFGADGTVAVTIGTQSSGQDHARPVTLYVAETLGLAADGLLSGKETATLCRSAAALAARNRR